MSLIHTSATALASVFIPIQPVPVATDVSTACLGLLVASCVIIASDRLSTQHSFWLVSTTPLRRLSVHNCLSPWRRTHPVLSVFQLGSHSHKRGVQLISPATSQSLLRIWAGSSLYTPAIAVPALFVTPPIAFIGGILKAIGNILWEVASNIVDAIVQIFSPLIDAVVFLLNQILLGIVEALFDLLLLSLLSFIVIPDPAANASLQNIFRISFAAVALFTSAGIIYTVLMNMFFQTDGSVDIHTLVANHARMFLLIIISRPLFELCIAVANFFSVLFFPVGYSLSRGGEYLSNIIASFGVFAAILILILFGTTVAISAIFLYISLAIRQVLVFTVYALLPILLYGQLFDRGPLSYLKQFAQVLFSLTAMLLILGLILGVFLQVGLAMSMYYITDTAEPAEHNLGLNPSQQASTTQPADGDLTGILDNLSPNTKEDSLCAPTLSECSSPSSSPSSSADATGMTADGVSGSTTAAFEYLLGLIFLIVPLWVMITATVSVIFSYLFAMFSTATSSRVGALFGG